MQYHFVTNSADGRDLLIFIDGLFAGLKLLTLVRMFIDLGLSSSTLGVRRDPAPCTHPA